MAIQDVSFPITGWGRPSLGDQLQLRLRYFGSTVIGSEWSHRHRAEPYWRCYANLAPGRLWLVPPWLDWAAACRGRVRHVNAHFEVPQWPAELCFRCFPAVVDVGPAGFEDLVATVIELAAAGPDAARYFRVTALVAAALERACTALSADQRRLLLADDDGLDALRTVIEHQLDGDCSNPALARLLAVSEPTLVRRFRSALGTSPARYVAERRIARAAELLAVGEESIERIAARCGFGDRHDFTRAVTRHVGISPARYRRRHRG